MQRTEVMQPLACQLCRRGRADVAYRGCRNRRTASAARFDVLRCAECGAGFLFPMPSGGELQELYAHDYHSHASPARRVTGIAAVLKDLCLVPYRLRYGNERGSFPPFGGKRLLDVGCGTGEYVASMAALGWRCTGIDISETAVATARRRVPDATFVRGAPGDEKFDGAFFDAVTLWHTLEHVPSPSDVVDWVSRLLVPGGRAVVGVPNFGSLEARLLGRRWIEIDVPGHLFFFTPTTLSALLRDGGFEIERIRPQVHPSSLTESLGFVLDDVRGVPIAKSRTWLYYLLYPLVVASYVMGNWGCIEVSAVKKAS
jgi:2-polyprenyl-3-methyl-5-hydroxy-6-metoxy-1,4-benzoquinol methylase